MNSLDNQLSDRPILGQWKFLISIILIATMMRVPLTVVGPLMGDIKADLMISNTVAGLLTTIPLIIFGLVSPYVIRIVQLSSLRHTVFIAITLIFLGLLIRVMGDINMFIAGTIFIAIGIAFTKKLGTGFFGGEGFILQKLEGDGLAFIHAGGTIVKRSLMPGETIKIDTGCLVAMTQDINYDIQFVGGIKNAVFGGEGLFFATLTGPGDVWIQSLPFSKLASRIYESTPQNLGKSVDEGSILGSLGNIFEK